MSDENIAVLRAFYEALNRGDWDAAKTRLSPDLEWEPDRRHPSAGTFRGPDGMRRFLEEMDAPFEHTVIEVEDILAGGDKLVGLLRIRRRPRGSSAEVDIRIGEVWTVRDGQLVHGEGFRQRERALEAAGLRA
jgi:ketosteroid isomerase-like protein